MEEIDIFVIDENDKKYIFEILPNIKCIDLIKKIETSLKKQNLTIRHKSKVYTIDKNENDILNLEQRDIIYIIRNINLEKYQPNKAPLNIKESNISIEQLNGILNLSILKHIAEKIEDIEKINSDELKGIISYLKNNEYEIEIKEGIIVSLKDKKGNNIMTYANYIDSIINKKELINLLNLFEIDQKNEIKKFWNNLIQYKDFNKLFENEFSKALEKSYFDYSLIGINIHEQKYIKTYMDNLNKCINRQRKYLFYCQQNEQISNNINENLHYSRKTNHGMGIYFSDMLDYISFYSDSNKYGKTISINSTFSCIAAEVYYNKDLKKDIIGSSYQIDELDHFSIKKEYHDKMVIKNGVHHIRIYPDNNEKINEKKNISEKPESNKFIANIYVISELEQILPLYSLTLKRNEYFVLWNDPNFKDYNGNEFYKFLEMKKKFIFEYKKLNAYFESSMEKSLEIIKRKKFNKIILISNIGMDLSGKRFVEIARKILGFDIVVLFFSANLNHLKWIQDFPNALYTTQNSFFEKYIMNYNEEGLLNLKKEIEQYYNIKLKFTKDFFAFPNFINEKEYKNILFEEISENFKKVMIKNIEYNNFLKMNENGEISIEKDEKIGSESLIWYVTMINSEITFFSNNFYLNIDKSNLIGNKYMIIWKYEKKRR